MSKVGKGNEISDFEISDLRWQVGMRSEIPGLRSQFSGHTRSLTTALEVVVESTRSRQTHSVQCLLRRDETSKTPSTSSSSHSYWPLHSVHYLLRQSLSRTHQSCDLLRR